MDQQSCYMALRTGRCPASNWPSPSKSTATGEAAEKLDLREPSKLMTWARWIRLE